MKIKSLLVIVFCSLLVACATTPPKKATYDRVVFENLDSRFNDVGR